jgi:glycosyltransferase involved in cell wall biosynthesis
MNGLKRNSQVSVVVPVIDFQQHKENLIQILQGINHEKFEVILVLDSQTPQITLEAKQIILNSGAKGRVLEVDCKNPGGARNAGLKAAVSEWIVFWDCDDLPNVENCLKLINQAILNGSNLAIGSFIVEKVDEKYQTRHIVESQHWPSQVGLNPGIWRMAFSRELVKHIKFPELSMGEDQVFIARVILAAPLVHISDIIVYRYRVGIPNQLTKNRKKVTEIRIANDLILSEISQIPQNNTVISAMIIRQTLTIMKNQGINIFAIFPLVLRILKLVMTRPEIVISVIALKISALGRKETHE